MNRLSAPLKTALFGLLAVAASQARADYLNWTYTATSSTPGVSVGAGSPNGGASVALVDYQTSQPGGTSIPVQAYVTATNLTSGVVFGPGVNSPSTYNLALAITDGTTHDSGTLNFTGSMAGTLTATTSSVVNTFTPVTTNVLTLDGHTYTVTIPAVTLLAPNNPQANILATVSVADANNGGGTPTPTPPGGPGNNHHGTPEPTSLVLGSLGFSCFGVSCWWKRRVALRRQLELTA